MRSLLALMVLGLAGCPEPEDENTDLDGDGYGPEEDCRNRDPEIHPGADERCDEVDNDCDGERDEDDAIDAPAWALDADGDGSGDPGAVVSACERPAGYVESQDDCDDQDATSYPGAAETCEDGVINDCDGSDEDAQASCKSLETRRIGSLADAVLLGEHEEDYAGGSVESAGDFNGDGRPDLALGASGMWNGSVASGGLYVLFTAEDTLPEGSLAQADVRLLGEREYDKAGSGAEGAGDVDGDGYDDVIAGGLGVDTAGETAGAAFVVHGGGAMSGALADAGDVLLGESEGDWAGGAVAGIGDTDGDGLADLLIGAHYNDHSTGAAYLVLGGSGTEGSLADARRKLVGELRGVQAGSSVDAAGDVNGDGLADMLVTAPLDSTADEYAVGAGYLVYGGADDAGTASLADADAKLVGEEAGAGYVVLRGDMDLNGDGGADIVVGAPSVGLDVGAVYVLLGSGTGFGSGAWTDCDGTLSGANSYGYAGGPLAAIRDSDGDSADDLLVGEPGLGPDSTVYVVYGVPGAAPTGSLPDVGRAITARGSESGVVSYVLGALADAGDLDGDGTTDIAIGSAWWDEAATDAGGAFLLSGALY